ncbi:MAG TPA: NAD(P)/FAD-dependent oxidoreductase [Dehalococcoidia bacterium]|nr:NAD(P)/FAD-dependent oxidoreductase [Dehalococcoidia bacterium]
MYDAIIAGARVAGAPTAMLLAQRAYKVLLVDRDTFPSDIMSTHYIHLAGQVRLQNWGLLDKVIASGAPWITRRTLYLNGMSIQPPDPPVPEGLSTDTLCPRRYILDKILADAAVEAGAELRQGFVVRELLWEDGRVVGIRGGPRGEEEEERARIVIGADGLHSLVAKEVEPEEYDVAGSLTFGYYTYWTNIEDTGMHIYFFDDAYGILVFPTNDGKTCIGVGGPSSMFHEFRKDIEANYLKALDKVPELAAQVKNAERERFLGTAEMPNYFRKPYGPGWALTGDAGYHRDFITGLGINDAFLQAELLADALHDAWSGNASEEDALAEFERKRNDYVKPCYDLTVKMAGGYELNPVEFMAFGAAMARQIPAAAAATA